MVSDNQGIHLDSELEVKDWQGKWHQIQETFRLAQERQREWHDQKPYLSPEYVTWEDVNTGRAKKANHVMWN